MTAATPPIMVMGVQGAGKSTIGTMLAERLGVSFVDGDRLHSDENVAKMAAGSALTDAERLPWLQEVGRVLKEGRSTGIVVVCSALKREYRDLIRGFVPELFTVDPEGPMQLVAERIRVRQHEYMPQQLLQSQYDTLEPLESDELGVVVDIRRSPQELIDSIVTALEQLQTNGRPPVAHH